MATTTALKPQSVPYAAFKPNKGKQLDIEVDGVTYMRLPIKTELITERDDLLALLRAYAGPH